MDVVQDDADDQLDHDVAAHQHVDAEVQRCQRGVQRALVQLQGRVTATKLTSGHGEVGGVLKRGTRTNKDEHFPFFFLLLVTIFLFFLFFFLV